MGTEQGSSLHYDTDGIETSRLHGDRGDGTDEWFGYTRVADGGDVALGVTTASPAASGVDGSLVAIMKGIRDFIAGKLGAPSNASVSAYAASLVVSANPGQLIGVRGYNSLTASGGQWIQLHDASSVPADSAVPELSIHVGPESNFEIDFGLLGRDFATGIVVCNSSTAETKTIGSADLWIDAQYRA